MRAVAAAPVPVVSGVGHEIDVTLADLAADLRALTPTDAAVRLAPDGSQVAATVTTLGLRLATELERRVTAARDRIARAARSRVFADPARIVRERQATVEQHALRLRRLAGVAVARGRERLAAAAGRLEAGSPLHLLARGWSLTSREDDPRALKSVAGLGVGTVVVTHLADGRFRSRVEGVVRDDRRT